MTGLEPRDEALLRRAIGLAEEAVRQGCRPFGAVLADADGRIVAEGYSTQQRDRDWTAHAELAVLRAAGRSLAWDDLGRSTLYASSDPCPMCAGALYWSNVRRLVFGLGEAGMRPLRAGSAQGRGLVLSCREVLAHSPHPIEIIGPMLENLAARAHAAYWSVPRPAEGWAVGAAPAQAPRAGSSRPGQ